MARDLGGTVLDFPSTSSRDEWGHVTGLGDTTADFRIFFVWRLEKARVRRRRRADGNTRPELSHRRSCDDAVDAFVERLNLKVTFPLLEAGRYSEKQLEEVRRRVKETIARDLRSCYAYNEHSIGGEGGIILIAVRLHPS